MSLFWEIKIIFLFSWNVLKKHSSRNTELPETQLSVLAFSGFWNYPAIAPSTHSVSLQTFSLESESYLIFQLSFLS